MSRVVSAGILAMKMKPYLKTAQTASAAEPSQPSSPRLPEGADGE